MRDWQRSNWEKKEVPPFEHLLEFLNLQVRDTENSVPDVVKKHPMASSPGKRTTKFYTASVEDTWVACKNDYLTLYGCKSFVALLPDKRIRLVRDSHLCNNCLHMAKQCPSSQKCRKCRRSHHSLLHKDWIKKPSQSGNPCSLQRLDKILRLL